MHQLVFGTANRMETKTANSSRMQKNVAIHIFIVPNTPTPVYWGPRK